MKDGSAFDPKIESAGCGQVVSFLCVPMLVDLAENNEKAVDSKGVCCGVLIAANKSVVAGEHTGSILPFTRWDEEHVTLIAQHLVHALERCRIHDEEREMKVSKWCPFGSTDTHPDRDWDRTDVKRF